MRKRKKRPGRELHERHARSAENPEDELQALIAVNPEAGPELSDEDLREIVGGAPADPERDEP